MPEHPSPFTVTLGHVVRRLREERGLSQESLARSSGLHPNEIGLVERAERNPGWPVVVQIANGLDMSLAELGEQFDQYRARQARPR